MTRYLLDTNVVSALRRSAADPRVTAWARGVRGEDLLLSALTIGEIHQGMVRLARRDPQQAAALRTWLARLENRYGDSVLPVTPAVARRWAELTTVRTLPVVAGLIAATALEAGAVLVTRNVRDLQGVDVPMLDPFGGGAA